MIVLIGKTVGGRRGRRRGGRVEETEKVVKTRAEQQTKKSRLSPHVSWVARARACLDCPRASSTNLLSLSDKALTIISRKSHAPLYVGIIVLLSGETIETRLRALPPGPRSWPSRSGCLLDSTSHHEDAAPCLPQLSRRPQPPTMQSASGRLHRLRAHGRSLPQRGRAPMS